jgi:hypothetical protein
MFKYIFLFAVFVLAGYFDVQTIFQPIATSLLFLCLVVGWLYRKIIEKVLPFIVFGRGFFVFGLLLCLLNFCVGVSLNKIVDQAAVNITASLEVYNNIHKEFPDSLAKIDNSNDPSEISRGRLKFGSRFYYLKTKDTFDFGYRIFPFGVRVWDPSAKQFKDAPD